MLTSMIFLASAKLVSLATVTASPKRQTKSHFTRMGSPDFVEWHLEWLRRGHPASLRCLAEPETLHLPGHRLGEIAEVLDHARILVALEMVFAPLLQLSSQLDRACLVGSEDYGRADAHDAVDRQADDGCLAHRDVLQESILHLD